MQIGEDGAAADAELKRPTEVAATADGEYLTADLHDTTVVIAHSARATPA